MSRRQWTGLAGILFVVIFLANSLQFQWHAWRTREPQHLLLALCWLVFLVVGVLLRAREVFVAPKEQVAYQLAYGDMNHAVDTVLVDGTPVVRDGKVTTVDVDALLDEAAALAARIWEGLPERMKNYEQTAPLLQRLENEVRRRPWSRATGV